MKVAIVGVALETHDDAPFHDPEWECWGLPWDTGFSVHYDRLFEMHPRWAIESEDSLRPPGYMEELREAVVPLYMHQHFPDIPMSRPFPFDEVNAEVFHHFPRADQDDYYDNSPTYPLAMAIAEGAEEIAFYGILLDFGGRHVFSLPNMNYLIGIAVERGIKVHIPERSCLCKHYDLPINFGKTHLVYPRRYGFEE